MANLLDKIRGKDNNTVGNVDKFSSAVSDLSNTLMDFNSDFKSTTTAFTNDLRGILNKASQNNSDSNNEQSDNNDDFLRKLERNTEKSIDKTQVISSAVIKSFEAVAGYAIKKFTDASSRVMSDYNQNLTAITVRQQWTNSQYTKELREATDWIKNNGLVTQFSQIDWTSALSDALSMGLRDEVAVRVAEQNLITNKLLPQLNTSSRTYTRASKLLGDDLGKNVVAIGKYTEQLYGAEGLEDGQVNNFLETISKEIIASGAQNGLSEAEVSEQLGNVLGTYQQYSAQFGSEYAENVLGSLKGVMSGNLDDVMANQAMQGSGIEIGNSASLTPENISKYFEIYTQKTDEAGKRAGAGVMANMAGYGNYDNILAVQISNAYGNKVKDWMSQVSDTVNVDNLYNKDLNDLKKGDYQSITDQQNKWNENMVANASSLLAEKIPDTEGVLNNISGVLTTWFGVWTTLNTAGKLFGNEGGSAGGKLGSKLFGKGGALGQGGKLALTAADSAGGTALTGLGTALSAASIFAGLAIAGANGIQGMNDKRMQGDKANAFFANALTGNASTYGYSDTDKLAVAKERSNSFLGLDWKAVGSATASGALVGGGSGALIGSAVPGAGTAAGAGIGALVGGAVGAISSATDQWAEMADYNKVLKHGLGKFADAVGETTDSINANTDSLQEVNSLQASIESLKNSLEDTSDMTSAEIAQKEKELAVEEKLLGIKIKQLNTDSEDLSDAADAANQLMNKAEALSDFATKYENSEFTDMDDFMKSLGISDFTDTYGGEIGNAVTSDNYDTLIEHLGGLENVNAILSSLGKDEITADSSKDNKEILSNLIMSMADTQGLEGATAGRNYGNIINVGPSALKAIAGDAMNTAADAYNAINQSVLTRGATTSAGFTGDDYYKMMQDTLEATYKSSDPSKYSDKTATDMVKSLITGATDDEIKGYLTWIKSQDSTAWDSSLWKDSDTRFFKHGSDYISHDGQLGSMHQGEAVLTAVTAQKLREMSSGAGGITGFVNTLFSLSKSDVPTSSAAGSDTEVSLDPVVDAIKEQTTELQDSLSKIMILISALVPETEFAEVDKLLATYQGASA